MRHRLLALLFSGALLPAIQAIIVFDLTLSVRGLAAETDGARLFTGLGGLHHPVTTQRVEAQHYFDQGLTLLYAFNHPEAVRSFRQAEMLDPGLALAHWGAAVALGSNLNARAKPEALREAWNELQKARNLSAQASPTERAYIVALSARYAIAASGKVVEDDAAYVRAMETLQANNPDDPDAAALFADSVLTASLGTLWDKGGKALGRVEAAITALTVTLRDYPTHVGANHCYIHLVEDSPNPERALPCAERLESLMPASGHILHMPSHIYLRLGDYQRAALANDAGIKADRRYFELCGQAPEEAGAYFNYFSHNLKFLMVCRALEERRLEARAAADELAAIARRRLPNNPAVEATASNQFMVMAWFKQWDEILGATEPKGLAVTHAAWRYARGVALIAHRDLAAAASESLALDAELEAIGPTRRMGGNTVVNDFAPAVHSLRSRLASAKGDLPLALIEARAAVDAEALLDNNDPPDWWSSCHNLLGAELLRQGRPADAEVEFRASLSRAPRQARALIGLKAAMQAEGKPAEVISLIESQLAEVLTRANPIPSLSDL